MEVIESYYRVSFIVNSFFCWQILILGYIWGFKRVSGAIFSVERLFLSSMKTLGIFNSSYFLLIRISFSIKKKINSLLSVNQQLNSTISRPLLVLLDLTGWRCMDCMSIISSRTSISFCWSLDWIIILTFSIICLVSWNI